MSNFFTKKCQNNKLFLANLKIFCFLIFVFKKLLKTEKKISYFLVKKQLNTLLKMYIIL